MNALFDQMPKGRRDVPDAGRHTPGYCSGRTSATSPGRPVGGPCGLRRARQDVQQARGLIGNAHKLYQMARWRSTCAAATTQNTVRAACSSWQ